jgi:3-phosphoshikimate 1-carboxyvinyltransferase
MPVTLIGAARPICVDTEVAVASAQVKSALLLAALGAPGRSRIVQRELTRDHTEKMFKAFGADITVEPLSDGGEAVHVLGEADLKSCAVEVPRDPSSAAFALVAALIVPGSEITLPAILLNPRRIGLIETLLEMGADIRVANERESGGERIGDLIVKSSALKGVEVPPERAPSMIDEYPILSVAAAFAEGRTTMHGLQELRVKESDVGYRERSEDLRTFDRGNRRFAFRGRLRRRRAGRRARRNAYGSPHRNEFPHPGPRQPGRRLCRRHRHDRHQLPGVREVDA